MPTRRTRKPDPSKMPEPPPGSLAGDMLRLARSGQVSPRVGNWLTALVVGDWVETQEDIRRRRARGF